MANGGRRPPLRGILPAGQLGKLDIQWEINRQGRARLTPIRAPGPAHKGDKEEVPTPRTIANRYSLVQRTYDSRTQILCHRHRGRCQVLPLPIEHAQPIKAQRVLLSGGRERRWRRKTAEKTPLI